MVSSVRRVGSRLEDMHHNRIIEEPVAARVLRSLRRCRVQFLEAMQPYGLDSFKDRQEEPVDGQYLCWFSI